MSKPSKKSIVENILYDSICAGKLQELIEENNTVEWNKRYREELEYAYDLLAENWSILQKDSMFVGNRPKIVSVFKKIYARQPRLCEKLFPIVYFIIVDNIQKIKKKSSDEICDFVSDNLTGEYVNDYIYSLLDFDKERKVSRGSKQRKRFQAIFEKSEKKKTVDAMDINLFLINWNDNYIKDNLWINEVRDMYLSDYRKKETKRTAEKMYALFQFVSKLWESKAFKYSME